MDICALVTGQVYEFLAFVVALYFPFALVAWVVIDKCFVSVHVEAHARQGKMGVHSSKPVLADDGPPNV